MSRVSVVGLLINSARANSDSLRFRFEHNVAACSARFCSIIVSITYSATGESREIEREREREREKERKGERVLGVGTEINRRRRVSKVREREKEVK